MIETRFWSFCFDIFVILGGISGTPMFTVNDVIVSADASWGLEEWRKVIDPLLGDNVHIILFKTTSSF